MAFHHRPNKKKSGESDLMPGEPMSALMPLEGKEPLGPLVGPLSVPEPGPEQPGYEPRKTGRGHARGFFCDRFVY